MTESIYYCKKENNNCPKKDSCKRYLEADSKDCATLSRMACTKDNDYVLFLKCEKDGEM